MTISQLSSLQHSSWMYVTVTHMAGLILPMWQRPHIDDSFGACLSVWWWLYAIFLHCLLLFTSCLHSLNLKLKQWFLSNVRCGLFFSVVWVRFLSLNVARVLTESITVYWPKSNWKNPPQKTTCIHAQLTFHSSFCPRTGLQLRLFQAESIE